MAIFHIGQLDKGKKVDGLMKWGCNIVVSPVSIPPPTNEVSLQRHLDRGAFLVYALSEDAFPDDPTDFITQSAISNLSLMRGMGAGSNQSMLLLVGDKSYKSFAYRDLAKEWVKRGGVYHYLDNDEDVHDHLEGWESVSTSEFNLVSFLAMLPGVNYRRAEILADKYGLESLFYLTYAIAPENILHMPGFEGMSLGQIKEVRRKLQLADNQELVVHELSDEDVREREFYSLADELNGKAIKVGE